MSNAEHNPVVSENTTKNLPVRKHPAHPVPVEGHNTAIILFVTLAIQPRGTALCNANFHEAFLSACRDADAWNVGRYVIMPDHVHFFCAPVQWPAIEIKRWGGYLKERITKRLKKMLEDGVSEGLEGETSASRNACPSFIRLSTASPSSPSDLASATQYTMEGEAVPSRKTTQTLPWRWQSDVWDVQMRSGDHYHEKWNYVRLNPIRAGLTQDPDGWPWQGEVNVLQW
jgi:putative transposase